MSNRSVEIKMKLQKSKAFFEEVVILIQNKFYNTAINRLYYSCFHATTALLLSKNLTTKTHSGVGTLLQKEFVQKGLFDIKHASHFSKLMSERNESDYGDYLIIDEKDIDEFLEPSRRYIEYVTAMVMAYVENLPDE